MAKHETVEGTPSIVMLGVADEKELRQVLTKTAQAGIKCYAFFEPDIGHQMTAFATRLVNNEERRIFKGYKLL